MTDIIGEIRELVKKMKHETDYLTRDGIADAIELRLRALENHPQQLLPDDERDFLTHATQRCDAKALWKG